MKKILYLLVFLSLFSCEKLNVDGEEQFSGIYKVINDPLKCALPTTNQVSLKHKTGNEYEISFKHISSGNQTIKNVEVLEQNHQKILWLDNSQIGIYKKDTYFELGKKSSTQTEGYVLYLNADINGMHLEFMGKK